MSGTVAIKVSYDSNAITYTEGWATWDLDDSAVTVNGARTAGLSVSFSFPGTGIEMWGYFYNDSQPTLLCNIDQGTIEIQPSTYPAYSSGLTLWRTAYEDSLRQGTHNFTCEVASPTFYLDHFVVHPSDPEALLLGSLATQTSNGTNATAISNSMEKTNNRLLVGVIVGGVVGGLALLGAIVAAVLFYRRSRKNDRTRVQFASIDSDTDDDYGFNSARRKHGLRASINTLISRLRKNHTREVTHHEYSADSRPYAVEQFPSIPEPLETHFRSQSPASQVQGYRPSSEHPAMHIPSQPTRWDSDPEVVMEEKSQRERLCRSPEQDLFANLPASRDLRSASGSSTDRAGNSGSQMRQLMLLKSV